MDRRAEGYALGIGAAATFGAFAALSKAALAGFPPAALILVMNLTAGVTLLPLAGPPRFRRDDLRLLLAISAAGAFAAPVLYLSGLERSTGVTGSLLVNMEAMFTVMIAHVLFRERAGRMEYFGVALLVLGAAITSTNLDPAAFLGVASLGAALMVVGTFLWGIDNNLSRVLSGRQPVARVACYKVWIGSAFLAPLVVATGGMPSVGGTALLFALLAGVFSVGIGIMAFYGASVRLGSLRAGALLSTAPLAGVLLSVAVLGEGLGPGQVLGGAALVAGALLLFLGRPAEEPPPLVSV